MKRIILLLSILLTSCGIINNPSLVKEPPKPAPVTSEVQITSTEIMVSGSSVSSSHALKVNKTRVALREYLYRSQPLKGSDYNLVILTRKPISEKESNKALFLCELWKDSITDKDEYLKEIKSYEDIYIIPFYWPLKKKISDFSCQELIKNYDYERVNVLLQTLKLKSETPQLLYRTNKAIVTMDLSKIFIKDDMAIAMQIWTENMTMHFDENTKLNPNTLVSSIKKVLGLLGNYITFKV